MEGITARYMIQLTIRYSGDFHMALERYKGLNKFVCKAYSPLQQFIVRIARMVMLVSQ